MQVHLTVHDAHATNILALAFNPFQKRIFTGAEDSIKVWDAETGRCERVLKEHDGWVTDLAVCENILFSCSLDGSVMAWSPIQLKMFYVKKLNAPVCCLAWEEKRKLLVAGGKGGIYVFDVNKTRFEAAEHLLDQVMQPIKLPLANDFARKLYCSEGRIVCGSFEKYLLVYEAATGRLVFRIPNAHKSALTVVALDPESNRIMTGGFDRRVKIWNQDGSLVYELGPFGDAITGIAYNAVTKTIWIAANSTQPQIYDPTTGGNITDFATNALRDDDDDRVEDKGMVQMLQFFPFTSEMIGTTCYTTSIQRGLVSWRRNPFSTISTLDGGSDVVEALACTARGVPQLFSAGEDRLVHKWEVGRSDARISQQATYPGHAASILALLYIDSAHILVSAGADKSVRLWCFTPLPREKVRVRAAAAAASVGGPTGDAAGEDATALDQIMHREQQKMQELSEQLQIDVDSMRFISQKVSGFDYRYVLEGHSDKVTAVALVQKHRRNYLLSTGWDLSVVFWDISRDSHNLKRQIADAHTDYILDLVYAPERDEFATAAADGCAKIWTLETFEVARTLRGHQSEVTHVRWSPAGAGAREPTWVTGSKDHSIIVWRVDGTQRNRIRTAGEVTALCIDSAGYVVAGTSDLVMRVLDPAEGDILQENVGHKDVITSIIHMHSSNHYVSASWDKTIRLWAARSPAAAAANVDAAAVAAAAAAAATAAAAAAGSDLLKAATPPPPVASRSLRRGVAAGGIFETTLNFSKNREFDDDGGLRRGRIAGGSSTATAAGAGGGSGGGGGASGSGGEDGGPASISAAGLREKKDPFTLVDVDVAFIKKLIR